MVPAAREDGWEQDPFAPQVRDGQIVGRGACVVPLTVWTTYGVVTTKTQGYLSSASVVVMKLVGDSSLNSVFTAISVSSAFVGLTARFISLTTVSSMISFGALAAFSASISR